MHSADQRPKHISTVHEVDWCLTFLSVDRNQEISLLLAGSEASMPECLVYFCSPLLVNNSETTVLVNRINKNMIVLVLGFWLEVAGLKLGRVWITHWYVHCICTCTCWSFGLLMVLAGRGINPEGWQGLVCLCRCLWDYSQTMQTNRCRINRDCACLFWSVLGPWAAGIAGPAGTRSLPSSPAVSAPSSGLLDSSEVEQPLEPQPQSGPANGPSNTSTVLLVNHSSSPSLCSPTSAQTVGLTAPVALESSTPNPKLTEIGLEAQSIPNLVACSLTPLKLV